MEIEDRFHLYLPESFEWLLLKSGILQDSDLKKLLDEPYNYIESSENFSWERYFTKVLINKTADTHMKYTKHILNPFYLQEKMWKKLCIRSKG